MKSNSPQLIPINQIESDIIQVNLPLPDFLKTERIGIDILRLETLCRVAGIKTLNIGRMNTDENSETISISGINHDGTAAGVATREVVKSKSISRREEHGVFWRKFSIGVHAMIKISMNALMQRISARDEKGARSIEGWSQELEEIILRHVKKEGLHNLLSPNGEDVMSDINMAITPLMGYYLLYLDLGDNIKNLPIKTILVALFFICRTAGQVITKREMTVSDEDWRISPLSIGGIEWDRALMFLRMIANTRGLVSEITDIE